MTFKVTFSTMGVSTPASVAEGTRYYTYGGDQPLRESRPPAAAIAKARTAKEKRFRVFCAHREAGKTVAEAGELAEVSICTARTYEREREALRTGETP